MLKSSTVKKIATLGIAGAMACGMLGMAGCGGSSSSSSASASSSSSSASSAASSSSAASTSLKKAADPIGVHHAVIEVEGYGPISVELDGDSAPVTVQNFMDLANDGFYDGLTFHRVIKGFMIQGGDPKGNGLGGSKKTITGEFSENGIKNDISHVRGVISMARSQDYNSASSQFFIVHEDSQASLDGKYAAFGHVTKGMEIVDEIAENTPSDPDDGYVSKKDQPVIESIKLIED